ncbi:MAG: hypothetical protein EHM42_14835, partial [Planctomycetaceae bacterium]
MSISPDPPGLDDLDLVCQGPSHKLSERLGLANSSGPFRLKKILLLMLVTWLPLLLLSAWAGRAVRGEGGVPFLQDPEINAKLLVVIPFLEVSALIVPASLAAQARRFATTGLIPEQSLPR